MYHRLHGQNPKNGVMYGLATTRAEPFSLAAEIAAKRWPTLVAATRCRRETLRMMRPPNCGYRVWRKSMSSIPGSASRSRSSDRRLCERERSCSILFNKNSWNLETSWTTPVRAASSPHQRRIQEPGSFSFFQPRSRSNRNPQPALPTRVRAPSLATESDHWNPQHGQERGSRQGSGFSFFVRLAHFPRSASQP